MDRQDFRVVVLQGTGSDARVDADAGLVRAALTELGFQRDG